MEIPKGLGSMKTLLKRADKAREVWELWRSIHQEAFDFSAPQRSTFHQHSPGQRKNRHVFDSTAIDGLVTFANRIQGALVPAWMEWQKLVSGTDIPDEEKDKLNTLLEKETETFFSIVNHSNFSTEITPSFSDLGIGTGAIQLDEGLFNEESPVLFSNVPLAELHPETPIKGIIENVWRPQEVEAGMIQQTWPKADLPPEVLQRAEKQPHFKEKILNGMLLNPKDRLYHQLVIHKAKKKLIFTQSFKTKRLIVFRWHVTPGETFGRGPILDKMADIRTVNKVKEFILQNAAIQMAGMYTGRDDGVFNPQTVRIAPGIVMPVSSNETKNPSLAALPRAGDIGIGDLILKDLQESIKKSLLADPLGDFEDPVRTLGEQMMRMQETLKDRGASFGRLKSELIEPVVAGIVDIAQSQGKMAPIIINGKEVTIHHSSPLAKAEDMEDFQNSQLYMEMLGSLPQELVMGTVRLEDFPKYWGEKLSMPAEFNRDDDEREAFAKGLIEVARQGGIDEKGTTGQA